MKNLRQPVLSIEEIRLFKCAKKAASHYLNKRTTRHVGAAILCRNGKIYQGASIRRVNGSSSTCAERMALDRALFDQNFAIQLIAIIGYHDNNNLNDMVSPCGLCRQILSEAESYSQSKQAIPIILASANLSHIVRTNSRKLLPLAYKGKDS